MVEVVFTVVSRNLSGLFEVNHANRVRVPMHGVLTQPVRGHLSNTDRNVTF